MPESSPRASAPTAPLRVAQLEDLHVHSTFSDGRGSLQDNIARAERLGLRRLGCVDHVRADTTWLPRYVAAVRAAAEGTAVRLECGIEAKLLDASGRLDLPPDHLLADRIYAADHRFPWKDDCLSPQRVRAMREAREATDTELIGALLTATANAMRRHAGLTIAHLFSVLPKVGLHEESVSDAQVHQLATLARATGATLEISERWRCPSLRVARIFAQERVPLVASSDAHRPTDIGRYDHVARVAAELAAGPATGAGA